MNIWVIKIGEPLEFDYSNVRLLRSSILAKEFANRKIHVDFFVDKFDHFRKINRNIDCYDNQEFLKYHFLNGITYHKNLSVSRFINHFQVGVDFYFKAVKLKVLPDFVIISYPTIFLAFFASLYCSKRKIPYIIDIRDSWPSIFSKYKIVKTGLYIYYKPILKYIFKNAYHITGCTPEFRHLPSKFTNIKVPFTYIPHTFPSSSNQNLNVNGKLRNAIVYFGAISKQRRLDEFLDMFSELDLNIDFIICGNGDQYNNLKTKFNKFNIIWLGQVDQKVMSEIASRSIFGVAPYELHEGYRDNVPNKIIEYLSYGLPVITNIDNAILDEINRSINAIFVYKNKNDLIKILNKKFDTDYSKKIKDVFHSNFSVESFVSKFYNILDGKN